MLGLNQAFSAPAGLDKIDRGGLRRGTRGDIGQFTDQASRGVDASFGFGGARLRASPKPFHLPADEILERFLTLTLRLEELLLRGQKFAVVAVHPEKAVRIGAIDLHHPVGYVLQKIAVVADG